MRVAITKPDGGLYIATMLSSARGSMVLRRWPWPHNEAQRAKHLGDAVRYGESLARLLGCPCNVDMDKGE